MREWGGEGPHQRGLCHSESHRFEMKMCEEDLFSNVRRCLHLSFVWFKNKNANRKFSLLNLVVYFTFYLTFNKFISCHIQWMLFHGYSTSLQIIGIGWLMSLKWIFTIEIHLKALDSSQNIANTRTKKSFWKKSFIFLEI